MSPLRVTPSQTIGPFFGVGPTRDERPSSLKNVLVGPGSTGHRIRVQGRVLEGGLAPVPDSMLEIWQADAQGRYHHPADARPEAAAPLDPAFTGFGRAATDENGGYWFETVKPGRVPGPGAELQAPHIVVTVFARGLLNHAVTRLYFADEPSNAEDAVLACVPANRRDSLLAQPVQHPDGLTYTFDIILQGPRETPFFNL